MPIKPVLVALLAPLLLGAGTTASAQQRIAPQTDSGHDPLQEQETEKTEPESPTEAFARATYVAWDIYRAIGTLGKQDFIGAMAQDGVDVTLLGYDVKRRAWQLMLGYRYHPRMAVEIGYLDLGEARFFFDAQAADAATLSRAMSDNLPISGSGWTLANRFDLPLGRWRASATAGFYFWNDDPDTSDPALDPNSRSGADPLIGLELAYPLSEHIELGLQYRHLFLDDQNANLWGGRLAWTF